MPVVRFTRSLRLFSEFTIGLMSSALTAKAPSFTFCVWVFPYTSTEFNATALSCNVKLLFFILPDVEGLFHGLVAQEGDDEGVFARSDLQ